MFVYDGTFIPEAERQGLYVYRMDPISHRMEQIQRFDIASPAYLAFSPDKTRLYAASRHNTRHGADHDLLAAFSIDRETGLLDLLNTVKAPVEPSYISVDGTGRFAAFACAFTGTAGVAGIAPDGSFDGRVHSVLHEGVSVMGQGRPANWWKGVAWPPGTPFPHSARFSPDNRFVLVPDIGLNRVMIYRLDAERARIEPNDPPWVEGAPLTDPRLPPGTSHWETPSGAGPRHMEFHPNGRWLYVVNEVGSTVSVFDWAAGRGVATMIQDITTLPDDYRDFNMTADIHVHPNGRFVYATNRGQDSLVTYAVDPERGTLTAIAYTSSEGDFPRTFTMNAEGTLLVVGNMLSNSAAVFNLDPQTGALSFTGASNEAPSASCLLVLSVVDQA